MIETSHPIHRHRRSRTARKPTGKTVRLTSRDIDILQWLYRYRFLSSHELARFCQPVSHKRFVERLGDLYHELGVIDRPAQQWEHGRARYRHCIYSISTAGLETLQSRSSVGHQAYLSERRRPGHRVPQFEHALAANRYLAAQELNCRAVEDQRFVTVSEIINRRAERMHSSQAAPLLSFPAHIRSNQLNHANGVQTHVVPDGLYGIEYQSSGRPTYRFFALEIERTTPLRRRSLFKSSTLKKLLAYSAALNSGSYKAALGIPNLFPVFIGRDDDHVVAIEGLAEELLDPNALPLFRFAVAEA